MIRHVVLLRFHESATPSQIARYSDEVPTLASIAGVKSILFGAKVSAGTAGVLDPDAIPPDNWDFVVSAEFETYDDYLSYAHHPLHRALIADHLADILSERAAIQIECS